MPSTPTGPSDDTSNDMTAEEKRHDQLTSAPQADESDAAPRIDVTDKGDGVTRIDIREDAKYRPGSTDDESTSEK